MRISKVAGIDVPADEPLCIVLEEVAGPRKPPLQVGMTETFDLPSRDYQVRFRDNRTMEMR
jgi:hypothetical protein